eukprot:RCo048840
MLFSPRRDAIGDIQGTPGSSWGVAALQGDAFPPASLPLRSSPHCSHPSVVLSLRSPHATLAPAPLNDPEGSVFSPITEASANDSPEALSDGPQPSSGMDSSRVGAHRGEEEVPSVRGSRSSLMALLGGASDLLG